MNNLRSFLLALALFTALTTLPIQAVAVQPVRTITVSPKIEPTLGIVSQRYVIIESFNDNRTFQQISDSSKAIGSSPFDMPVATDLSDTETLSRAVGWTVRGQGEKTTRHYRLLLPEDRSVKSLIQTAVVEELKAMGYRVVDSSHEKAGEALQMNIEIEKFWAWLGADTNPFWSSHSFHGVIELSLTGDVFPDGRAAVAHGAVTLRGTSPSRAGAWVNTIQKTLNNFRSNFRGILVPATP